MAMIDCSDHKDPLDLLRRFIPTPLKTRFRLGDLRVEVETNDFGLLPVLPLEQDSNDDREPRIGWKLVRDRDTSCVLEKPLVLTSGNLIVVTMGPACLLGVDLDHGELLCFIGSGVESRTYQDYLVPFLCSLSQQKIGNFGELDFADVDGGTADA